MPGSSTPKKSTVALRKESVDRNYGDLAQFREIVKSLSARRAWIEITALRLQGIFSFVALRKESVDRNRKVGNTLRTSV